MCKNPVTWVEDPDVPPPHNFRPYTCDEYIDALEKLFLQVADTADSSRLDSLRRAYGRTPEPESEVRLKSGGMVTLHITEPAPTPQIIMICRVHSRTNCRICARSGLG